MVKTKINLSTAKLLLILSLVATLIILSFIVDSLRYRSSKKTNQSETTTIQEYLPKPTATPTLTIDAYTVYNLEIRTKTNNEFNFENFIFQFANPKIRSFDSSNIAYTDSFRVYSSPETTKTKHRYILMTLKDADIKPLYEDDQYHVAVTPNSSLNINYLYSNNYCQTSSDCLIKEYFCRYGAFNKYERIRTSYGCEGNIHDYQNDYYFGPYDKVLKCNSQIIYQSAKCINNKCIGQGRTTKCVGKLEVHP